MSQPNSGHQCSQNGFARVGATQYFSSATRRPQAQRPQQPTRKSSARVDRMLGHHNTNLIATVEVAELYAQAFREPFGLLSATRQRGSAWACLVRKA